MSKGLVALEVIKHTTDLDRPNELNGYHNEICDVEKELKALEIIKEKRVDVLVLVQYMKEKPNDTWALESYNHYCEDKKNCKYYDGRDYLKPKSLTQEEYELLKEVLL